jgi:DNA-binding response OmpR family regulator
LLTTLRSLSVDVPIEVLSARDDEASKVKALDLGADDYITKPFGMKELLARLRAALRHQLQVQGEHLANKYQPSRTRGRHPAEILIADVLAIYLTDVAPRHAREDETKQRVLTLDSCSAEVDPKPRVPDHSRKYSRPMDPRPIPAANKIVSDNCEAAFAKNDTSLFLTIF